MVRWRNIPYKLHKDDLKLIKCTDQSVCHGNHRFAKCCSDKPLELPDVDVLQVYNLHDK